MPVASESDLKDCEWVVERCKSHLKNNDRDGAKAWIITARSLFPDNFAVQVWTERERKWCSLHCTV